MLFNLNVEICQKIIFTKCIMDSASKTKINQCGCVVSVLFIIKGIYFYNIFKLQKTSPIACKGNPSNFSITIKELIAKKIYKRDGCVSIDLEYDSKEISYKISASGNVHNLKLVCKPIENEVRKKNIKSKTPISKNINVKMAPYESIYKVSSWSVKHPYGGGSFTPK